MVTTDDVEPADTAPAAPEIDFDVSEAAFVCDTSGGQPLTDPIVIQACLLDRDPVKIYEFVRNEFTYEPYVGSLKGAARTLQEGAGNDLDLASLLIALLRASGVPARYVFGTIEMPIEDASAWIGIEDGQQLVGFLTNAGIALEVDEINGQPTTIRMDHVWVKAHVGLFPYRGARSGTGVIAPQQGDTWVEMDASFKQHTFSGTDLSSDIAASPSSLRINAINSGLLSGPEADSSITSIDHDLIRMQLDMLAPEVRSLLAAESLSVEEVFYRRLVHDERLGFHPVTDQYRVVSRGCVFRSLPSDLHHSVTFRLINGNGEGAPESLSHTASLPDLLGKRVALGYIPTPEVGQRVIDELDRLLAAETPDTALIAEIDDLNAALVELKPQLYIDGQVVAPANTDDQFVMLGHEQLLEIVLSAPGRSDRWFSRPLVAGGVHAMVVNGQRIPQATIDALRNDLIDVSDTNVLGALPEAEGVQSTIGRALHGAGLTYFHQADRFNEITAGNLGVITVRQPSLVRVSWDMDVVHMGDTPIAASAVAMRMDVIADTHIVASIDRAPETDRFDPEDQFVFTSGLTSNALEANALGQSLDASSVPSVIRCVAEANETGVPIYTVTPKNFNRFDVFNSVPTPPSIRRVDRSSCQILPRP